VHDRDSLWPFFLAQVAVNLVVTVRFGFAPARTSPGPPPRLRAWLRVFAAPFVLRSALSIITIGVVFIYSLGCTPEVVAIYAAADRALRYAIMGIAPLFSLAAPYLFAPEFSQVRERGGFRWRYLATMVAVGCVGGAVMALLGPLAVQVVYGERFAAAVAPLRLLALALPLYMASNTLVSQMLVAAGRELHATVCLCLVAGVVAALGLSGSLHTPMQLAWVTVAAEAGVALLALACLPRTPRAVVA